MKQHLCKNLGPRDSAPTLKNRPSAVVRFSACSLVLSNVVVVISVADIIWFPQNNHTTVDTKQADGSHQIELEEEESYMTFMTILLCLRKHK